MPEVFLITGVLDIHWNIEMDTEKRHLSYLIVSDNLKQLVSETTYRDDHILVIHTGHAYALFLYLPASRTIQLQIQILICANLVALKKLLSTIGLKQLLFYDINGSEPFTNPSTNLDGALSQYDKMTRNVIHKRAPFESHTMVSPPTVPWFTDEISEAKCVLRQQERTRRRTRLTVYRQIFQHQRLHLKDLINSNNAASLQQ